MRIASYEHHGRSSYGVLTDESTVADAGAVLGGRHVDVLSVLDAGALDELAEAARRAPLLPMSEVSLHPPLESPRIFCIGVNYRSHRDEMGHSDVPYPTVFVRFASSLVGCDSAIVRPRASEHFDFEGELAVVIGASGRHISRDHALRHVAGYTGFQDGSVRDFQRHTSQFTPGKNFDRSGAMGPWLVTADELGDPTSLQLTTRVNDAVVQQATTDQLINDIPTLIEYLSTVTELQPGDVIATGTPGGVGAARTPPLWLRAGDVVEVEISRIGVLRNPVVAEDRTEGAGNYG